MYRNKNYNIEDTLTYTLDGESDFEDLNDSDSEFEPEDVTVNEVDLILWRQIRMNLSSIRMLV